MLTFPKSILQQLACSSCKKYLSVPPIKVYPNRQVKCGRCCQEDDGGTSSSLYETVLENIKFPCIRHMEGCNIILSMSEMKNHEDSCHGKKYCCTACNKYEDYSYGLAIHIEKEHKDLLLKNAYFLLSFDKVGATGTSDHDQTLETRKYFYYDHEVLVFIWVSYNSKTLYLELHVVGNDDKPARAEYSLFSIENKLLYEGKTSKCAKWDYVGTETMTLDLGSLRFPNIMFCKFQVFREYSALLPIGHTLIIDPAATEAILRCEFENISSLVENISIGSGDKYYVNNKPCNVMIRKQMFVKELYLSCFLKIGNIDETCKAYMKITLFCQDKKGNKESHGPCLFTNKEPSLGFRKFIKWETVTNVRNGYLRNNSIKIDVKLKIIQSKNVHCITCNTDLSACSKQ